MTSTIVSANLPAIYLGLFLFVLDVTAPAQSGELIDRGVQNFQAAEYVQAAAYFQKAISTAPRSVDLYLYLGLAYLAEDRHSRDPEVERKAADSFQKALEFVPNEQTALAALATLSYRQAIRGDFVKEAGLQEARGWSEKLLVADPRSALAWSILAAIDWARATTPLMDARRARAEGKPEDSGPLPNPGSLRARIGPMYDEAIKLFQRSLDIESNNADAIEYMGLCLYGRAFLAENRSQYERGVQEAEKWFSKAEATRKAIAEGKVRIKPGSRLRIDPTPWLNLEMPLVPPPAPPPPPPPPVY